MGSKRDRATALAALSMIVIPILVIGGICVAGAFLAWWLFGLIF